MAGTNGEEEMQESFAAALFGVLEPVRKHKPRARTFKEKERK